MTETKAWRIERLKREKNLWEGLDEAQRFAREGFSAIPPTGFRRPSPGRVPHGVEG